MKANCKGRKLPTKRTEYGFKAMMKGKELQFMVY
jgi:hypothetical protein